MLVKDFIDNTLTSDNFNKMVVNLIGHFGTMVREIEHNRPEFSQIMERKLLWTDDNALLGAKDFPAKYNAEYGMYFSTEAYEDNPTFLAFKEKLSQFQEAVKALPAEISKEDEGLIETSTLRNLFPVEKEDGKVQMPRIFAAKDGNVQILTEENYGFNGKRDLDFYDMFNTGVYSFEEVAYYELNKDDGSSLETADLKDFDCDTILGHLLVFMVRYGYTAADFENFVENFDIIG